MKKLFSLILSLSVLMTGCSADNTQTAGSDIPQPSPSPAQIITEPEIPDLTNEFRPLENQPDKDTLHIINTGYADKDIYITDKTSGYDILKAVNPENNTFSPICDMENCHHTDESCNGYIPYNNEFVSTWGNEYIIYKEITRDENYPFTQTAHYYRMDSNGSNKKYLTSEYSTSIDFDKIILQKGNKLYFHIGHTGTFSGAVSGIGCMDIETGHYECIADYNMMYYTNILGIYKDKLLICVNPSVKEDDYTKMTLHLLDISTYKSECIYTGDTSGCNRNKYTYYNGYVYEIPDKDIFTVNKINLETGGKELFYQNTSLVCKDDRRLQAVFGKIAVFNHGSTTPYFAFNLDSGRYYKSLPIHSDMLPLFVFKETENSLLVTIGSTEYFYSDKEREKHHVSNYWARNYAFISKSDFLNGNNNYILIQSAN